MNKNTQFPAYRRLSTLDVFYRIDSADAFFEVKKFGSRWMVTLVEAKQYPEKLRIMDMISEEMGFVAVVHSSEIELIEREISACKH